MPLVRRTRATLRRAEFGFLGVVVYTLVQTPRRSALGMFDTTIGFGPAGKVAWMFGGGLLTGFGTRLANGCTSGHGIFGNANLEWPSVVASICFMASGVLTTQVVYRLLF